MKREFIEVAVVDKCYTIWLSRPAKSNAYHAAMANELTDVLDAIRADRAAEAVFLRARGKNFCTGADLTWMAAAATLSSSENVEDMRCILRMYRALLECELPIVTYAQGKIRGGGIGLVAVSDVCVCAPEADFALSETQLGLIPGIITPLVRHRIGAVPFEDLAASSRTFGSLEAKALGLVSKVCSMPEFEEATRARQHDAQIRRPRGHELADVLLEMEDFLLASAARRQGPAFQAQVRRFLK